MHTVRGDITDPRLLMAKGVLLLATGLLASALVVLGFRTPGVITWPVLAACHAAAVWSFCRAYYFAFYVVHMYVEPGTRYAGLVHAARAAWRSARSRRTST